MEQQSSGRLAAIGRFFLDSVFPQFCIECDREGAALCCVCCSLAAPSVSRFCPVCMAPRERVGKCESCVGDLDALLAIARARDPLIRRAVHDVKFGFREAVAVTLGERLGELLVEEMLPERLVLIPVPLSRRRMITRDFNQSLRIAQGLMTVASCEGWVLRPDLIVRTRATQAQATLDGRDARFTNVAGAFAATGPISGPVLLVDDVATTGATLQACAAAARAAGASQVFAAVIAHG